MTMPENFRKDVLAACQSIARDLEAHLPGLKFQFILYRRGQRQDECERALAQLQGHPCEAQARELMRETSALPNNSSFTGIVTVSEKKLMGFRHKNYQLGFATINIDSYTGLEDCLSDLYHITAQIIDAYQLVLKNPNESRLILQPKRNYLALARNNLKSDIFSALMMHVQGKDKAVHKLAEYRAKNSLIAQSFHQPENFPFVISTDVMHHSVKNLLTDKDNLASVIKLSEKISVTFDKHHLKSWINFCSPAQIMAWNGFSPEEILGTALHSSSDPFIKATANLISEITRILPQINAYIPNASNPYVDNETNSRNHIRLLEESFEVAITDAIKTDSPLPLIQTANNQNEALTKGRMLGWCADALQSAAGTFEQTAKKGMSPGPASRIEFQRLSSKTDWDTLESLNSQMIAQKRSGRVMTFSEIIKLCGNKLEFKHIMDSLRLSMNDPEYSAQLNYVNELPKPNMSLAPKQGPAPQITAAPAMAHGHALQTGVGGMMGGGVSARVKTAVPQKITVADESGREEQT